MGIQDKGVIDKILSYIHTTHGNQGVSSAKN